LVLSLLKVLPESFRVEWSQLVWFRVEGVEVFSQEVDEVVDGLGSHLLHAGTSSEVVELVEGVEQLRGKLIDGFRVDLGDEATDLFVFTFVKNRVEFCSLLSTFVQLILADNRGRVEKVESVHACGGVWHGYLALIDGLLDQFILLIESIFIELQKIFLKLILCQMVNLVCFLDFCLKKIHET
jgi:hypothetical protein